MKIRAFFLTVILILTPTLLFAASGKKSHVKADLFTQDSEVTPGSVSLVAVGLKMDPTWHTYWKNPGDSGLATKMKWDLPEGVKAGSIEWPAPEKFTANGITSYGYSGEVYLFVPIEISPQVEVGQKIKLKVNVSWVACQEICIFGKGKAEADLKVGAEKKINPKTEKTFKEKLALMPLKKSSWKITGSIQDKALLLEIHPPAGKETNLTQVEFFPDDRRLIKHAEPQIFKPVLDGSYRLIAPLAATYKSVKWVSGVLVASTAWDSESPSQALNFEFSIEEEKK